MYCRFAQYLFDTTTTSGHQISRYITSVQQWHKRNFISLQRKTMGTLALLLKALKKQKPKKSRPTRPISAQIISMWQPHLTTSMDDITYATAMYIAYAHLLRAGEYTCSAEAFQIDPAYRLNWQDITIGTDINNLPRILKVVIKKSKLFDKYFKPENTYSECTCNQLPFCALHQFLKLFNLVKPTDTTKPVFTIGGTWLTHTTMNKFIKKLCDLSNLDPQYYAPHGFRAGKCTDLKRKGVEDTIIQQIGRWHSDCWIQHYLKLDMFDILRFSK